MHIGPDQGQGTHWGQTFFQKLISGPLSNLLQVFSPLNDFVTFPHSNMYATKFDRAVK